MDSPTPLPEHKLSRRRYLMAGAGACATLAGAGAAWWHSHSGDINVEASALWSLSFDTPLGGSLPMQSLRGRPLLVNFWATWCPPCVEELPLIDGFFQKNSAKSWQVIGLAIDQPSAVRTFLQRHPVTFPIGLAGLGGTELARELGNTSGGLPFTVVLDGRGRIVQRRIGRVSSADLAAWATVA